MRLIFFTAYPQKTCHLIIACQRTLGILKSNCLPGMRLYRNQFNLYHCHNLNIHLQKLEDLEKARKLWHDSEWRLNFLRSITASPNREPTEEELLQWYR